MSLPRYYLNDLNTQNSTVYTAWTVKCVFNLYFVGPLFTYRKVDNNHGITAMKFQLGISLGKNSIFDINLTVQGVHVRIVYDRGAGKKYY